MNQGLLLCYVIILCLLVNINANSATTCSFVAVVAVGFGILTGCIVIFAFVLARYLKRRYPAEKDKDTTTPLCETFSDPRVRSRTIIQQDVPLFHLPTIVPFSIQQPLSKPLSDTESEECYDGYQLIRQQIQRDNLARSRQSLSLEDINTVSPPLLTPRKKFSTDSLYSTHSDGSLTQMKIPGGKRQRKTAISARKLSVNLGRLEFSVYYDQAFRLLQIYVNRGYEIKGTLGGKDALPDLLVIASLSLNDLKVVWEDETKTVSQSVNPLFNQKLNDAHGIDAADLPDLRLRFQVLDDYASVIIGEVTHHLDGLSPNKLHTQTKPLEAIQVYSDDDQLIYRSEPPRLGELLVALCHNPTDHKLVVKVREARDLVFPRKSGIPDPYVKVEVLFCGKKLFCKSTKVAHKTSEPLFDETFVFDVNSEKLPQIALVLKVKHHGMVRDSGMSVLHLGYCVNVESQYKHWEQVLQKPHLEIGQWHRLHDYDTAGDF